MCNLPPHFWEMLEEEPDTWADGLPPEMQLQLRELLLEHRPSEYIRGWQVERTPAYICMYKGPMQISLSRYGGAASLSYGAPGSLLKQVLKSEDIEARDETSMILDALERLVPGEFLDGAS